MQYLTGFLRIRACLIILFTIVVFALDIGSTTSLSAQTQSSDYQYRGAEHYDYDQPFDRTYFSLLVKRTRFDLNLNYEYKFTAPSDPSKNVTHGYKSSRKVSGYGGGLAFQGLNDEEIYSIFFGFNFFKMTAEQLVVNDRELEYWQQPGYKMDFFFTFGIAPEPVYVGIGPELGFLKLKQGYIQGQKSVPSFDYRSMTIGLTIPANIRIGPVIVGMRYSFVKPVSRYRAACKRLFYDCNTESVSYEVETKGFRAKAYKELVFEAGINFETKHELRKKHRRANR